MPYNKYIAKDKGGKASAHGSDRRRLWASRSLPTSLIAASFGEMSASGIPRLQDALLLPGAGRDGRPDNSCIVISTCAASIAAPQISVKIPVAPARAESGRDGRPDNSCVVTSTCAASIAALQIRAKIQAAAKIKAAPARAESGQDGRPDSSCVVVSSCAASITAPLFKSAKTQSSAES